MIMMLIGPFSLLFLAFAIPSLSAPILTSSINAYNISRNDNVRISDLDLRGRTLIFPTACCVCRHDFLQKVPILTTTRYWGQDGAGNQKDISAYCKDNITDNIIIAFLDVFFGEGGEPEINLANVCFQKSFQTLRRIILTEAKTCSSSGGNAFEGTNLADCSWMAAQIKECQNNGKTVTLSLGGAASAPGFTSDSQAQAFADQIWNSFLGGSDGPRPFGTAVLDG